MKTTILAMIAALGVTAGAASADNFENNTYGVNITSGVMDFGVDGNEDGLTNFETGVTGFGYATGAYEGEVRAALTYDLDADTIGVRGEYNAGYDLGRNFAAYGSVAVEYATLDNDLGNGDFFFDPSVGVSYVFSNTVSVFGEVGYTWDITNDNVASGFEDNGYVEFGVPLTVSSTVTVTPSVVREIDTVDEETNLNLDVTLNF